MAEASTPTESKTSKKDRLIAQQSAYFRAGGSDSNPLTSPHLESEDPTAPLQPAVWKDDSHSNNCRGCSETFNMFTRRRHHCRGCGDLFCNACLVQVPMGQYGILTAAWGCAECVAPWVEDHKIADLPAAGGAVEFKAFNVEPEGFSAELDNKPVPSVVKSRKGTGFTVTLTVPSGSGSNHVLILKRKGADAILSTKMSVSYAKPTAELAAAGTKVPAEGGRVTLKVSGFSSATVTVNGSPVKINAEGTVEVNVPAGTGAASLEVTSAGDPVVTVTVPRAAPVVQERKPEAIEKKAVVVEANTGCC